MIVERSMHPDWLANTYLVAEAPGGSAVFVDAGAPIEALVARAIELELQVTHVLLTHDHHDHVTHMVELEERFGAQVVLAEQAEHGMELQVGSLRLHAVSTPGHCSPHVAWAVRSSAAGTVLFTGDVLFRETVGGTIHGGADGLQWLRGSVLELLHAFPAETVIYPGHAAASTVGHELANNPFVRAWLEGVPGPGEDVEVAGHAATLLLEGADYDGGTKAWVRFADGAEAIVGGSMVHRAGTRA